MYLEDGTILEQYVNGEPIEKEDLIAFDEYARNRKQGGKKIGDYQAVSHKIADMKSGMNDMPL